jgi:predicted nucleic acid-binding protein
LGAGESEVLSYTLLRPDYTAMIDDAAARRCAISLNISTLGTGGMIVLAKHRGLVPSVLNPIQALRNAGLWLSDDLVNLLKRQAGE